MHQSDVATPFVLIDGPQLHRNIRAMADRATELGAKLRPHFKSHQAPAIANMQLAAGAAGLTCATSTQLHQAVDLVADVLLARPVQLDSASHSRLRSATQQSDVRFVVDSPATVETLKHAVGRAEVLIEIDVGTNRGGVHIDEVEDALTVCKRHGMRVVGVLSYPGPAYAPDRSRAAASQEAELLARAARALERNGCYSPVTSAGSTPTLPHYEPGAATEFRPGSYVLGDRKQLHLGSIEVTDVAAHVVATVLHVSSGQVVLDAGSAAIGRDTPTWLCGFAELRDGGEVTTVFDYHSVARVDSGSSHSPGDRVQVRLNNANVIPHLFSEMWVDDGTGTVSRITCGAGAS